MKITPETRPVKRKIALMVRTHLNSHIQTRSSILKLIIISELFNVLNVQRQPYVRMKDRINDASQH